jgi:hypothetical protein
MKNYIILADFRNTGAILSQLDIEFEAEDDKAAFRVVDEIQESKDAEYIAEKVAAGMDESTVRNSDDFLNAQNFSESLYRITGIDEDGFQCMVKVERKTA